MMTDTALQHSRQFLTDRIRQEVDFSTTDQNRGIPAPPLEKPHDPDAVCVALPGPDQWHGIEPVSVEAAIRERQSRRRFSEDPLRLDELAFLLWSTQGLRRIVNADTALRTVPSAGARHAFETYLCVLNVEGLEGGLFRYLPLEHALVRLCAVEHLADRLTAATLGQAFAGRAAVTFVWAALPVRMEWRYGLASHKVMALDAGHVCQNLYLACETIHAGTCAMAAYDQDAMDALIGVDGTEEFVVYLAPVGHRRCACSG